ncbi:MAG: VOC family protein [Methylotenera sp.]
MPVTKLNHVNIRTPYETMLKLKDFYCDVVGLKVGPRIGFTSRGFWLYIGDDAVLHLAEYRGDGEPLTNVLTTLDHISFTCTDMPAMEMHLTALNISYTIRDLPAINVRQINFKDPVGNGIELFFNMADEVV